MSARSILVTKGTPREVAATLSRIEVEIAMADVEMRMLRLSMRCQERTR
jgi:hypothetical protein